MYLKVSKNYSISDSELAKTERNDCMVRSLASAAGISYRSAHKYCKDELGREFKRGTNAATLADKFKKAEKDGLKIDNKEFSVRQLGKTEIKNKYKLKGEIIWRKKTLKSFMESHPKGSFMVMVAKHALTVKDGELMDWDSHAFEPTRKVMGAYELKRKDNQIVQLKLF